MGEENGTAAGAFGGFSKKRIARRARRGLDRHPFCLRDGTHICHAEFTFKLISASEALYKMRVCITGSATQLMVQMADDQCPVADIDQPVQQRDGIAPAG